MTDTQDKKKRSTLTLNRSVATTTVDKPSNVQQNMTNNKFNNVTVEVRKNKFARPDDEQKKNLDKMLSEGHLSEDELKARLRAVVKNNASSTEKIAHTPSYSSMKKDINQTISDEDNVNNELESQDSDVIQEKEELDVNALENIPELKQVDELNTKEKQPGFDDSTISNKSKTEIAANFNDTEEESDFVKSKNAKSPKNTIVKKLEQKFAPKIHEVEEEYTGGRRIGTPKKSKKQKIREKIKFDKLVREVFVPENITVSELANRMSERSVDVIKELMKLGIMANAAQKIDQDTAEIIVTSLGHIFRPVS
jgi:translation initiation factor IF-2